MDSEEGISSNILADRLGRLVEAGLLTRRSDSRHRQRVIYSLTEKAIDLVPVLVHLGAWGRKHLPAGEAQSQPSRMLEEGGPVMWRALQEELRRVHLGGEPPSSGAPILEALQRAP